MNALTAIVLGLAALIFLGLLTYVALKKER